MIVRLKLLYYRSIITTIKLKLLSESYIVPTTFVQLELFCIYRLDDGSSQIVLTYTVKCAIGTFQESLGSFAKMQLQVEKLLFSEDILDASLAKCLAPIHLAQLFFGSIRADIRNCFVTPTTKLQKIYTVLFVIVVTISYFWFVSLFVKKFSSVSSGFYVPVASISILYVAYTVSIYNARFFKPEESVRLYLMLQKVDRVVKLRDSESMNQYIYAFLITVVPLTLIIQTAGALILYRFTFDNYETVIFILPYGTCIVTLYLELYLCGSSIWYLRVRLLILNTILRYNVMNNKNTQTAGTLWVLKEDYKFNDVDYCEGLKMITTSFKTILHTFQLIPELFQTSVST